MSSSSTVFDPAEPCSYPAERWYLADTSSGAFPVGYSACVDADSGRLDNLCASNGGDACNCRRLEQQEATGGVVLNFVVCLRTNASTVCDATQSMVQCSSSFSTTSDETRTTTTTPSISTQFSTTDSPSDTDINVSTTNNDDSSSENSGSAIVVDTPMLIFIIVSSLIVLGSIIFMILISRRHKRNNIRPPGGIAGVLGSATVAVALVDSSHALPSSTSSDRKRPNNSQEQNGIKFLPQNVTHIYRGPSQSTGSSVFSTTAVTSQLKGALQSHQSIRTSTQSGASSSVQPIHSRSTISTLQTSSTTSTSSSSKARVYISQQSLLEIDSMHLEEGKEEEEEDEEYDDDNDFFADDIETMRTMDSTRRGPLLTSSANLFTERLSSTSDTWSDSDERASEHV